MSKKTDAKQTSFEILSKRRMKNVCENSIACHQTRSIETKNANMNQLFCRNATFRVCFILKTKVLLCK